MLENLGEEELGHTSHCNVSELTSFTNHLKKSLLLFNNERAKLTLSSRWEPSESLEALCKRLDDEADVFSFKAYSIC